MAKWRLTTGMKNGNEQYEHAMHDACRTAPQPAAQAQKLLQII
jgi:hypothetical protein